MEKAIHNRDFEAFAVLSMKDSNNFHATCLDTQPPIFYMNDTSRAAVRMVEAINATHPEGKTYAAYTFDAGPNAVVYYLAKDEDVVAGVFKGLLGEKTGWDNPRGKKVKTAEAILEGTEVAGERLKEGISRVILTSVGDGPRKTEEHLC
jgi:diphosphomevalonate decarboxylase